MNKEERIYSVTMTEDELRLFSEFLEQKVFFDDSKSNSKWLKSHNSTKELENPKEEDVRRVGKRPDLIPKIEEAVDEAKKGFDSLAFVENNYKDKSAIYKLSDSQRMSKRFIEDKNPEFQDLYKIKNKTTVDPETWSTENLKHDAELAGKKMAAHARTAAIIDNERYLQDTGYDKKYAARGLERVLGRRISGDEAEAIVNNRITLNNEHVVPHDKDGLREAALHIGRRWDDAKMVYGEALDGRSLGKDAAMVAGASAALVGGGMALKKHLKKKRQEKELAESKYKTSKKDKKNK